MGRACRLLVLNHDGSRHDVSPMGTVMSAALTSAQQCSGPKPASEQLCGTADDVLAYFTWVDIARQY